jgi:hypothetical protein
MVRYESRHSNAEVYIEAVAQLESNPLYDAITLLGVFGFRFDWHGLKTSLVAGRQSFVLSLMVLTALANDHRLSTNNGS